MNATKTATLELTVQQWSIIVNALDRAKFESYKDLADEIAELTAVQWKESK